MLIKREEGETVGPLTRSRRRTWELEEGKGLNLRSRFVQHSVNWNSQRRFKVEIKEEVVDVDIKNEVFDVDIKEEVVHAEGNEQASSSVVEEEIEIKEECGFEEFSSVPSNCADFKEDLVLIHPLHVVDIHSPPRAVWPTEEQSTITFADAGGTDNWFKIKLVRNFTGEDGAMDKVVSDLSLIELTVKVQGNEAGFLPSEAVLNNYFESKESVTVFAELLDHADKNPENQGESPLESINTRVTFGNEFCLQRVPSSSTERDVVSADFLDDDGRHLENQGENTFEFLNTNVTFDKEIKLQRVPSALIESDSVPAEYLDDDTNFENQGSNSLESFNTFKNEINLQRVPSVPTESGDVPAELLDDANPENQGGNLLEPMDTSLTFGNGISPQQVPSALTESDAVTAELLNHYDDKNPVNQGENTVDNEIKLQQIPYAPKESDAVTADFLDDDSHPDNQGENKLKPMDTSVALDTEMNLQQVPSASTESDAVPAKVLDDDRHLGNQGENTLEPMKTSVTLHNEIYLQQVSSASTENDSVAAEVLDDNDDRHLENQGETTLESMNTSVTFGYGISLQREPSEASTEKDSVPAKLLVDKHSKSPGKTLLESMNDIGTLEMVKRNETGVLRSEEVLNNDFGSKESAIVFVELLNDVDVYYDTQEENWFDSINTCDIFVGDSQIIENDIKLQQVPSASMESDAVPAEFLNDVNDKTPESQEEKSLEFISIFKNKISLQRVPSVSTESDTVTADFLDYADDKNPGTQGEKTLESINTFNYEMEHQRVPSISTESDTVPVECLVDDNNKNWGKNSLASKDTSVIFKSDSQIFENGINQHNSFSPISDLISMSQFEMIYRGDSFKEQVSSLTKALELEQVQMEIEENVDKDKERPKMETFQLAFPLDCCTLGDQEDTSVGKFSYTMDKADVLRDKQLSDPFPFLFPGNMTNSHEDDFAESIAQRSAVADVGSTQDQEPVESNKKYFPSDNEGSTKSVEIGCCLGNIAHSSPTVGKEPAHCEEPLESLKEANGPLNLDQALSDLPLPVSGDISVEPDKLPVSPIPEDIEKSFYWSPTVRYMDMTPFLKDLNMRKINKAEDSGFELLQQVSKCQGISDAISKQYKLKQSLGLRPPDPQWVQDIGAEYRPEGSPLKSVRQPRVSKRNVVYYSSDSSTSPTRIKRRRRSGGRSLRRKK